MKASFLLALSLYCTFLVTAQNNVLALTGAWQHTANSGETICIIDGYIVYSKFDVAAKSFDHTWGGPYTIDGNKLVVKIEFNSKEKEIVGKEITLTVSKKDFLQIEGPSIKLTMKQTDNGNSNLAGNWRITGRKQGEQITEMPLRPRRTLKLLTANRFQWMAINTETGECSGTGGGYYTFVNGRYTEHIEFFSRDNNRVGASLSFDGKLVQGNWHHSGLSSKGEPIYEIWGRLKM